MLIEVTKEEAGFVRMLLESQAHSMSPEGATEEVRSLRELSQKFVDNQSVINDAWQAGQAKIADLTQWQQEIERRLQAFEHKSFRMAPVFRDPGKKSAPMQIWINKKTKDAVRLLYTAFHSGKDGCGSRMAVYQACEDQRLIFTCNEFEFKQKFTLGSPTW